jgi:hypothetical protein
LQVDSNDEPRICDREGVATSGAACLSLPTQITLTGKAIWNLYTSAVSAAGVARTLIRVIAEGSVSKTGVAAASKASFLVAAAGVWITGVGCALVYVDAFVTVPSKTRIADALVASAQVDAIRGVTTDGLVALAFVDVGATLPVAREAIGTNAESVSTFIADGIDGALGFTAKNPCQRIVFTPHRSFSALTTKRCRGTPA